MSNQTNWAFWTYENLFSPFSYEDQTQLGTWICPKPFVLNQITTGSLKRHIISGKIWQKLSKFPELPEKTTK